MPEVIADITVSLDGFVTGPDPDAEHGLGRGGEALHTWAVESTDEVDAAVLREAVEATGAIVMGRRLFDVVDGPHGWNDEMGYGAGHATTPPAFVVTHEEPATVRLRDRFTFVTDGLEAAIAQAVDAAGSRAAVVMGGAEVVRSAVDRGLVDELSLHIAPLLLGAGTPLFVGGERRERRELVQRSVRVSPHATHLRYALAG